MTPIATEIAALRELDVEALVGRYETLFGRPPRSKNREHLFRKIAHRMQEVRFGGLSNVARKRLAELAATIELPTATIAPTPQPKRGLAPGSVISRDWHGRRIEITVLDDGRFEHDGVPYRSLSAVAKAVTGAHWNGRLFFGIAETKR